MNKMIRWVLALFVLLMIPATWWATRVTDWEPIILGVYSLNRFFFNLLATAVLLAAVYYLLGSRSPRERLVSILATFLVGGICVFLLELPALALGFDYQKVFRTQNPGDALHLSTGVNKPDPVLIHIHWPNAAFSGDVVGNLAQLGIPDPDSHPVDVRYDSNGFRNDRDYTQADIAVIGDSFIEAAIIALDQTLVKRLETGTGVPTVNLGQIAYGLKQELEVLRRYALPLSPKVVIWALFGGNDLRDIDDYEATLGHLGEPPPSVPLKKRLFFRNLALVGTEALAGWFRDGPGATALDRSGFFRRADGASERVYFGQTNGPVTDRQWTVTTETLTEANRLSREAGARLILVYIPRKFRIYREHLELQPGTEIAGWDVNDLPARLDRWCRENGIDFVDTGPVLEKSVAQGIHPYFIDDVHWNPLGHRLASEALLEHMKRNGIHPFGPAP